MDKPPEVKSIAVFTRITPTLSIALEDCCKKLGITQADFLRQLIEQGVPKEAAADDEEEEKKRISQQLFLRSSRKQ